LCAVFRLGAALRAGFLVDLVDLFAAVFTVLRFLRAGAAFFLLDRFFAFFLFAMIDLPILYRFKSVRSVRRNSYLTRYDTIDAANPYSAGCQ
jgi:hypothetical protein